MTQGIQYSARSGLARCEDSAASRCYVYLSAVTCSVSVSALRVRTEEWGVMDQGQCCLSAARQTTAPLNTFLGQASLAGLRHPDSTPPPQPAPAGWQTNNIALQDTIKSQWNPVFSSLRHRHWICDANNTNHGGYQTILCFSIYCDF